MPEFLCRLGAPGGDIVQKVFAAENEAALKENLSSEGYHIFRVERRQPFREALGGLFHPRRAKMPQKDFILFNQEFAALVRAGLPILQGLEILLERMKEGVMKQTLEKVTREVREGKTLSEAFENCGDLFPPIYYASLRAGEQSGNIQEVLVRFIRYSQLTFEMRRRIFTMLLYPSVLVVVAMGLISLFIFYVLPRFMTIYEGSDQELPALTRAVMAVASFGIDHGGILLIGTVGLIVFYQGYRRTPRGRLQVDRWQLNIPGIGPILSKFNATQYTRTLGTLLAGGIPAVQALETAGRSLNNSYFVSRQEGIVERVREGSTMHAAMEDTGLFEHIVIEMVKVGESTGALVDMLQNLSDFYDRDIDASLSRIIVMLPPVILMTIAFVVGTILVSVYMAIFESFSAI